MGQAAPSVAPGDRQGWWLDEAPSDEAAPPLARDVDAEVAIVGGGESALSALVFLRAMRPEAKITVYTPMLPLSRGESFLENRVFADPDGNVLEIDYEMPYALDLSADGRNDEDEALVVSGRGEPLPSWLLEDWPAPEMKARIEGLQLQREASA